MNNQKNILKELKFLINLIFFSSLLIKAFSEECPEESPIFLKNGSCASLNCSLVEFVNGYCSISNRKIRTQWLSSIIIIGDWNFRYINFVTYSNGDFVAETTACPKDSRRMFYGLKANGRELFKNNSDETAFYSINTKDQENGGKKYEGEIFIIRITNDPDKEYILSITKISEYFELYDFENNEVYQEKISSKISEDYDSYRMFVLTKLFSDNKYYSILGFIKDNIYLYKFSFSSKNIDSNTIQKEVKTIGQAKGKSLTCFETENQLIICFYYNTNQNPTIYIMDQNLQEKNTLTLNDRGKSYNEDSFIKCIHLKGKIGIFSFYDIYSSSDDISYPFIYFKDFTNINNVINPIIGMNQDYIFLNLFKFYNNSIMNDLTKLSDTKICLTATSSEHDILYIVVLHIIDFVEIKVRYYSFEIYNLLYLKFLKDMKSYSYNDFLVIGASMCKQSECYDDHTDPHFSGLMFFSYPNSTDVNLDISYYLIENNDITIDNLEIDLKNYIKIENNIFGYIFSSIKIFNISQYKLIKLYSSTKSQEIYENYTLSINEKIKVKFINSNYLKDACSFQYYYIITEPDRDIYDKYPTVIDYNYGNDTDEFFNYMKKEYIGRTSNFKIYLDNKLENSCSEENCVLCKKDINKQYCITCNGEFFFDYNEDKTKIKKCYQAFSDLNASSELAEKSSIPTEDKTEETSIPTEEKTEETSTPTEEKTEENPTMTEEKSETDEEIKKCKIDEILDNKNDLCKNENIDESQSEEIYKKLIDECLNLECANNNKIIETKNIIYQLSTLEGQKYSNISFVSSIDLGKCEEKLRKKYNMDDEDEFIIIKRDIKNEVTTYVEYEIYNSRDLEVLSLDICNETQIIINIPVNLKEETERLYDNLAKLGYNLLDENDDFYNDICSTYTSESGTDMLLSDRKEKIYKNNGNLTLCQKGCQLESFNSTNKNAKCNCNVQTNKYIEKKNIETSDKFDQKYFTKKFLTTLKNSNFFVLKCYKLVIQFENYFKNIGRLIMTLLLIIVLILIFIFISSERKKINIFINIILKSINYNNNSNINKIKKKSSFNIKKNRTIKKSKTLVCKKNGKNKIKSFPPIKKLKRHKSLYNGDEMKNSSKLKLNLVNDVKIPKSKINLYNKKPTINININNINIKRSRKKSATHKPKNLSNIEIFNNPKEKVNKYKYNDRELNYLKYEEALKYDNRSYSQYYISLLKQNHIILFTFIQRNDYNLFSFKIILLLVSFSLYFTMNGFFFKDSTMHRIYENKGKYKILYQIPKIIYSSLVCAAINTILRQLSLSEKTILKLKQIDNNTIAQKKSRSIKGCLCLKFTIFCNLSLLFMIFFWYFISCFCAVFLNTQIILIKDTLISFSLSMIYPFCICLLPGIFRIISLRAKNKDKPNIYQFSLLLSFI